MENNQAQNQSQKEDEKKRRGLLLLLLLLLLFTIGIGGWALFLREEAPLPSGPQQEANGSVESIGGNDTTKLESPEGGGAVSLTYSKEVNVNLTEKMVSLIFGNPSRSTQDIILQLVAGDVVIFQSDLITPGNQVTSMALAQGIENQLASGSCEGRFFVSFYDQKSGEKSMFQIEIPVTITITP